MNRMEGQPLEERWNYLKDLTIKELGDFQLLSDSDLPWTFHTVVQKIKELEDEISSLRRPRGW